MNPALISAYRETDYIVRAAPEFVMRIDQPCAALAAYYTRRHIAAACVITACNPFSQPLPDAENLARQARLEQELQQAGWHWLPAVGRHPTNGWPPEAGCFVEGMSEEAASEWGRRHGQNAVVWCGEDAIPRLLLRR